jgi:RNA polymerase sigma factor (sigma-70 family)
MHIKGKFPRMSVADWETHLKILVISKSLPAMHKVVEGHICLALSMAVKFSKRVPKAKYDDLISESFRALSKAVMDYDSEKAAKYPMITVFIQQRIKSALKEYLIHDNLIYVPNESNHRISLTTIEPKHRAYIANHMFDVMDLIDGVFKDPVQRMIVHMKMLDYSNVEVAKELGVRPSEVHYMMKDIQQRMADYRRAN